MTIQRYLVESAARHASRVAIENPAGGSITYGELDELSNAVRDRLAKLGVRTGDRVGTYLRKSIDGVASFFGIAKRGAAYVPVDPLAPPVRNAFIFTDCAVAAVIVEKRFEAGLRDAIVALGAPVPPFVVVDDAGDGSTLRAAVRAHGDPVVASVESGPDDLAYVLYTSGSTGKPKGVTITNENATSFVQWCTETFEPTKDDRFSSHAPFHFDLSILDIYVSLRAGATLVLVNEDVGKEPVGLAKLISERRITIWYSAPSILALLAQYGKLATLDYSKLRTVLFAGEVFPVVHLRSLKKQWVGPRYYNLYGPTETNVCTYHEIPEVVPDDRTDPYPIGKTCSHLVDRVVDPEGREVPSGEGELCIAGPAVTPGYWNLPEQTRAAFLDTDDGRKWYRTGDLVVREAGRVYRYVGRKDRMIKKRGYRVELGEIEACLYRHPQVREAAVIALPDEQLGMRVRAHVSSRDDQKISLIQLKSFCSTHLPLYMIPDEVRFHPALPKTSTDKIDYQAIKNMA